MNTAKRTAQIHYYFLSACSFSLCAVCILLSSCAAFFQSKVSMDSTGSTATIADIVTSEKEDTSLGSPAQLYTSQGISPGIITVTWSAVSNASSYRLERAVVTSANEDGTYTAPEDESYDIITLSGSNTEKVYATSFKDTILAEPGSTNSEYAYRYYYRVCAENSAKGYDPGSYTVCSAPGYLFAPPSGTTAQMGVSTDSIRVSWTKSANAASYLIFRGTNSSGTGSEKVGSITANQNWYTDSIDTDGQGTDFYYKVYAVNANGTQSASSSLAMGYTLVTGAPGQVSGVAVVSGKGRGDSTDEIDITWTKLSSDSTLYYTVYRTSSTDSAYTLLSDKLTDVNTYADKKALKTNVYYYYQVQAWTLDSDTQAKLKGPISDSGSSSSSPAEGFILSPPAELSAEKDSSGSTVVFFSPAIGSASETASYSYEVYGDSSSTGTFASLASDSAFTVSSLTMSNGLYSAPVNAFAFYKIKTVNSGGTKSAFSSVTAPSPLAAADTAVTKYANLSSSLGDSFTANSNGVFPVLVTWSSPGDSTVAGYYVYRSSKSGASYRRINSDMIPAGTTSYADTENTTAKPGRFFYYKVLTVNSLDQGSHYSPESYGYGALTAEQYMREYNKTVMNSQSKLTLMHKSNNLDKLGSETISGAISGTLSYDASVSGLSGVVVMAYTNYADYYINDDSTLGIYFLLNGNTNTKANTSGNGSMYSSVTCTGMYPGSVGYDKIEIKGSAAGGGTYVINRTGFDETEISYTVGNE